jgi:membrane-bound metal-dependent hydrolase YbcI (DUF457 family)
MFAGHFGLAAAVKAKTPEVPLWALMVSTQLLDILFVPLFLSGAETIEGEGYGGGLIHADYTHSLLGTLLISMLAGLAAWRLWGKKGGGIIAGVVFSHWLLDLLVHRADLPLLPGNLGELPLLGLGIWRITSLSILLEASLIAVGAFLYGRSLLKGTHNKSTALPIMAAVVMGILLVLSLVTDVLGIEL